MAMNPDVCGWIVMDHTGIDYPIVQGEDNFEYLDKDPLGNPEISGSIFLDWQNNRKFTDPYMVLMGHHMQAGKMFGDLDKYSDETFSEKYNWENISAGPGAVPGNSCVSYSRCI